MQDFITEQILPNIGTFFSAILTGIVGFIFGKRKQKAEVESIEANTDTIEIDNASKVINIYKASLDDLEERCKKKYLSITELYDEKIKLLEDEIVILRRTISQLKDENQLLRKRLNSISH